MENLEKSILYTKKKKQHQISRLKSHQTKSIEGINEFLEDQKSAVAVTTGFEYLSTWSQWNFINNFIDSGTPDHDSLISATLYEIEANNVSFFLGKKVESYRHATPFHIAVKHMAQASLLGWDLLAIKYCRLLIEMLNGKQYKGWHDAYKHPWFIIRMFCKWQNIDFNYEKLNHPAQLGVYQDVLDNWDTRDTSLLSNLINKMVTFHIEQSDEYEHRNMTPDFSSSDYFIYPVEILVWLNIRNRLNLPDYLPDNDLMKMSINNTPPQTEVPKIELIEKSKEKLLKKYPGLEFEL